MVAMSDIFGDGVVEGTRAEEDHLVEAFGLDGQHEPFCKRIQIWMTRGQR
jgi:hypothetical protein